MAEGEKIVSPNWAMAGEAILKEEPEPLDDKDTLLEATAQALGENRVDGRNEWEPGDENRKAPGQGIPF